ncbi:ABC transporter ATP-binding protein [Jannaschia seohaensis]|uniref:Peptide/nickel transport system ATP-binding protein n=1 Tax=Jannaschia seohaensis TaxID=475081 RepID=A0A2Y9B8J3_9RHOB|nr:ABC transporter ATP-binding protein [Jannaschia seohaensis]PWJ10052.1 peptide/nickel transport system ATP-binding protein [Jannaschia seohaensis]SSA51808.1 peptide/nickel transport system ATP-binding protein [Jannaschia seohaensis]
MSAPVVLEVENLNTSFLLPSGEVKALRDVSFQLRRGEILGLVGESGSGKSITGLSINGLLSPPGRVMSGSIRLHGEEITGLPHAAMRRLRGAKIAMVFQDPMMTLNPVLRIGVQMGDALRAHLRISERECRARSVAALEEVGIPAPEDRLNAFPHQLSGGMRQRVAVAIALLHRPDLVIMDEPTTALDVTIQGQILALVQKLCRERGTALIWITHDLAVVAGLAERILVMYAGRIVEDGAIDDVLDTPAHPYTSGLIDSVPSRAQRGQRLRQIPGRMPALTDLPEGCAFRPRCGFATEACAAPQALRALGGLGGRHVRCCHPLIPVPS